MARGDKMANKERTNLKVFRVSRKLTQAEMAEKIGCTRATYSYVEKGKRYGRETFWNDLQAAFNIPDCDMWALKKID